MKNNKIELGFKIRVPVLALGSQTKNTICFARNNTAYISKIHADLSAPGDLADFENDAKYFLRKHPKVITCDLHPEYQSTKLAESLRTKYQVLYIQHHHAHIAACMAENGLTNQKIIGVAFDGTGLGKDHTLWGGEFLVCDYKKSMRRGHLKEIPLIGGERAILEPGRLVAAWFNFNKKINKSKILKKIYSSGINSPMSSSMGRLFDAAGSLVLHKDKASFEAELAIGLEKLAAKNRFYSQGYKFKLIKSKGNYILDPTSILRNMFSDLKAGKSKEKIAWRFHRSVSEMILKMCLALRREDKINKVALCGGVFQNKLLLNMALDLLSNKDFEVYTHKRFSCNDSSLSLGQAVIAGYGG